MGKISLVGSSRVQKHLRVEFRMNIRNVAIPYAPIGQIDANDL